MRHLAGATKARGPRKLPPQPTQLIRRGLVAHSSLPGTPPAQRSLPARYLRQTDVVLSSGCRRRAPAGPVPPRMRSPRGRHGRPGPGSSGGGALSTAESPGGGGGALSSAGGAASGAPPRLAKAGMETPPSPVEVCPSSSLPEPASRPSWSVGPGGGMAPHLLPRRGTRLRWFPSSRVGGSRASSPCFVGIQIGARGRPQPASSSPLPHW